MSELSSTRQMLVRRLFWRAADDDYICARLSAQNGLYRHFAWNAGQCLEKYVKCLILLAGGSAKFSHQFFEAFEVHVHKENKSKFPQTLDISSFTKIIKENKKYAQEDFFECLKRFEVMGNPSGRYRTVRSLIWPYDVQKLDRLVFLLRRLCAAPPAEKKSIEAHAQRLEQDHYYTSAIDWDTLNVAPSLRERKLKALKFENCANFPETYDESNGWYFLASDHPPHVTLDVMGTLSKTDLEWLNMKVKMPKGGV